VESHNHLGIYLRQDRATLVCLAGQGRDKKGLRCFSVSIADQQEQTPQLLAERIAEACSSHGAKFGDAAVALDCAMFMQHSVHSEFSDARKVAATVRFDTEEALATDIADVAVAFRIVSSDDSGANLDVFTMRRETLSEILIALQGVGIDPVTVEPDISCLSRYLGASETRDASSEHRPLYGVLSDSRGYLLGFSKPSEVSTMRAFPVAVARNREQLLAREVLITKALAESIGPIDHLRVFDAQGQVRAESLAEDVGLPVTACNLTELGKVQPGDTAGCANAVDFALACGAAMALSANDRNFNFRTDHMPYEGRKLRMNFALKFLSIAVTILLLAVGVHFQTHLLRVNQTRAALRSKLEPDYLAVMLGKTQMPDTVKKAVDDLKKDLKNLKIEKGIIEGAAQESLSGKLQLVIEAWKSCATKTDLRIDTVTINARNIHINGSTSSRSNTINGVFDAMEKAGLKLRDNRITHEGDRDNFDMTLEPEKQPDRR